MSRAQIFLILFLFSLSIFSARAEWDCTKPVPTESGLVRGAVEKETGTCVWRGIPYAQPPVGELRWKAPQAHPGWDGIREAVELAPQCMQKEVKGWMKLFSPNPSKKMSEDCLYLNIWRPKKPGKFPVMVWVHGGGYQWGTANSPFYWGDRLAEQGEVVVVSFNYRLNIFGFFAHPRLREEDPNHSTGNQGSLDQVMALRWVKENIAHFGGDPNNITIFGESAGGYSICTLLATPRAKGLFHRAIMMSGGCETVQELEQGYKVARQSALRVGCQPEDINCLRSIPAEKLLYQGASSMVALDYIPHIDGYFLTDTPLNMIKAGNFNQVPVMAGYNKDEMARLLLLNPKYALSPKSSYEKKLKKLGFSEKEIKALVQLYPLSEYKKPVYALGRMFGTDLTFACDTYYALTALSQYVPELYLYRFDYDGFMLSSIAGVAHAMELPYVFATLDRPPVNKLYHFANIKKAQKLSEKIQKYFVNFARSGNPNSAELPPFPGFKPGSPRIQILDEPIRTQQLDTVPRCQFWQEHKDKWVSIFSLLPF